MTPHIDINADLGECAPADDAALMPFISSANIACGLHAGSPQQMRETVGMCLAHGVAIGAHPSYLDREHFGRRDMDVSASEVYALVQYQIGALQAIAKGQDGQVTHVKPHGALYNRAAVDTTTADAIAQAIADIDRELLLVGLANSELLAAGRRSGLRTAAEGFADRGYNDDGLLLPRTQAGAHIDKVADAITQALSMLQRQTVTSINGNTIVLSIDTLCVHGDGPHALAFSSALHETLTRHGIAIRAVRT